MARVIIIGPGHPLRGGLATFNQRLAKEFIEKGDDCSIYSFSLQYPSIFFPGKSQYSDEPAPDGIQIHPVINSVNPLNWIKTGKRLKKERPDIIVVRFWIPFMGPALGTVLRHVKKNKHTKIVCIADNIIPHEHRACDRTFTRYFLKSCDAFITMSEKVFADLRKLEKNKPVKLIQHPLYDNFGAIIPKQEAREHLGLPPTDKIILFFGFIRRYKGLDILLKAMSDERIRNFGIKLLVAGEFYEDSKPYLKLIEQGAIKNSVILRTEFIPDQEVKYFLSAADLVVQPYRNATQSGVTPLAYHFEKPMIVTNVGGLPTLVPDGKAGLITEPQPEAIASAILRFYQLGENYFIPHLRTEKQKYSWGKLVEGIRELAGIGNRQ
jgi:glycosyltransferase involved in cell wall biosynthesis